MTILGGDGSPVRARTVDRSYTSAIPDRRRSWTAAPLLLACAVLAGACESSPPQTSGTTTTSDVPAPAPIIQAADCAEVATRTVDALQEYVDGFDDIDPEDLTDTAIANQADLDDISGAMRARAGALDCTDEALQRRLAENLPRLEGRTPLARGVAGTFRSALLGGDDPSDPGPTEMTVADAEQLVAAVGTAGAGSTVTLQAGDYLLDEPLVVYRPITIVGAGAERSTITSSSSGSTLLALADGMVRLDDVALSHVGDDPASVVIVVTGDIALSRVAIAGGRGEKAAGPEPASGAAQEVQGGYGVLLRTATAASELVDVTIHDNAGGGIVIAGAAAPTIRSARLERNGVCGICYLEQAGGTLDGASVHEHEIGIRASDRANPVIRDVTFTGTGTAAVVLAGETTPDLDRLSCDEAATGVVVMVEDADPVLGAEISCAVADGRD